MKNKINTLIIIIGVSLILYPIIAKIIMNYHETYVIKEYQKNVKTYDAEEIKDILDNAKKYNEDLTDTSKVKKEKESNKDDISNNSYIDLSNKGELLGYINIPKITVYLPIYNGTSDDILDSGVGLLKDSSLPVGGENTHAVITGHSGLIKAKMFDDITKLEIGDKFYIHILNKRLEYEVDNIQTVEPDYLETSQIIEGRDLVTLVTCTPYLINTHRLLVRGTRVNNTGEENVNLGESQEEIDNLQSINVINIILIAICILIVITIIAICLILRKRKKSKKETNNLEGNNGKE